MLMRATLAELCAIWNTALTMVYDFNGKVALVTGGAGGIGLTFVKELLKHGVKGVLIVDVNTQGEQVAKELGANKVAFIKTDVTNEAQFEAAFKECIKKFGGLDIVLNNAGNAIEKKWEFMNLLNTTAVVRGTLLGMKYMGKDKGGKGGVIINTASILGVRYLPGLPVYTATKHFVVAFGRSIGNPWYYNLTGVKVMNMCPGLSDTNLCNTASGLDGFEGLDQESVRQLLDLPLQKPENVARGLITMFHKGENGSTWIAENDQEAFEEKPKTQIYHA